MPIFQVTSRDNKATVTSIVGVRIIHALFSTCLIVDGTHAVYSCDCKKKMGEMKGCREECEQD
jgi:hypothetical protein